MKSVLADFEFNRAYIHSLRFIFWASLALAIAGCSGEQAGTAEEPVAATVTDASDPAKSSDEESGEAAAPARKPAILVTGITGRQGGAVARELLDRGFRVRGLTRDLSQPEVEEWTGQGVEMVQGDFADPVSLERAMQGMYGVFLNTPNVPAQVEMGENAVNAAKAAGVQHLVYSTYSRADPDYGDPTLPKAIVEQILRDSGLDYTILRPVTFMENFAGREQELAATGIQDPRRPQTKQLFISVLDIAFFVAEAFEHPEIWIGREENIAGDKLTNQDLVEVFSNVMGTPINLEQISWEKWAEDNPASIVELYKWYEDSGFDVDVPALREQYPGLRTFERFLREGGWEQWKEKKEGSEESATTR